MAFRLKKIFWFIFLSIDLLILCLIVGGVYFFESDASKTALENTLGKTINRKVVIDNNLDLTFYPWFGLNCGPIHIFSNAGGTSEQFSAEKVKIGVRLLSLFVGNLEFDTVRIDSPSIKVIRSKDGEFDIPFAKGITQNTHDNFEIPIMNFVSVLGIDVNNATCSYQDNKSDNNFNITGLSIRTGIVSSDNPVAFNIGADFNTELFNINAQANLKGLVDFSIADHKIKISDTSLDARATSLALLGRNNTLELTTKLDFDPVNGSVDINGLVVRGNAATLSGSGSGRNLYESPVIEGDLKSTKFDPRVFFERYLPQKITIKSDEVFSSADLSCGFRVSADGADFKNILMNVDDTHWSGFLSLKDFSNPMCEFDLKADYLKLDKYIPVFRKAVRAFNQSKESHTPNQKASVKIKNIADYVRMIPCSGVLGIDHFLVGGFDLKDVDVSVSPGPSVLDLKIGSGKFYDGAFTMSSSLTMENDDSGLLSFKSNGSISTFSLAKLYPSSNGSVRVLSGSGSAEKVSVNSSGRTISELLANFDSKLNLVFKSVKIGLPEDSVSAPYKKIYIRDARINADIRSPEGERPSAEYYGQRADINFNILADNPASKITGYFKGDIFHSYTDGKMRIDFSKADFKLQGSGAGIPIIRKPLTVAGNLGYSTENNIIDLDNVVVSTKGIALHIDSDIKNLGGEIESSGNVYLGKTKCESIFKLLGVEKPVTNTPGAFDTVALNSSYKLKDKNLKLNITKVVLDDASAAATIDIPDFTTPEFNFNIFADKVDVDRFLPPDDEITTAEGNSTEVVKLPEWKFPDKFLGLIKADGKISCKDIKIFDISGENITADVSMKNAVIDITDIASKFNGGNIKGNLSIGLKHGIVDLDMDFDADQFNAGSFFKEFVGKEYVKGLADANLDITGRSSANEMFVDTLKGSLIFNIKDGEYRFKSSGSSTGKKKQDVKATRFSLARGHLRGVEEGKFNVQDFLLKTRFITATAKGGFNIPDDNISVLVKVNIITFPDLYLKLLNTILSAISGVDVDISGRLTQPHVEVKGLMRWDNVFEDILGLPGQSFSFIRDALF